MRSVRCDVCGTKALTAASQCPKCGHGFEVRDGFGELLPLSHCSTCDSYYPTKLGACRWCGTQPERAPIGPYVWKGAVKGRTIIATKNAAIAFERRHRRRGMVITRGERVHHMPERRCKTGKQKPKRSIKSS